ncbi:hypothetical protein FG93_00965 [Bosea sp. LC85]|uniref:hypothetical protein n=1 Tax=Bosea sp. LC85 TaxID=1502851 RepID=UPI0004E3C7A1|nr:hypothetical protein [Bosea sp. LC85]KFC74786.1 hypothetical protein FG93_00965 [Bosea sp. LC85]
MAEPDLPILAPGLDSDAAGIDLALLDYLSAEATGPQSSRAGDDLSLIIRHQPVSVDLHGNIRHRYGMHEFPPASELDHLIGDTLMQVCLDPFGLQFRFERSTITSERAVEHIEPDGTAWSYRCVADEAPATKLHRLVGRRVTSLSSTGMRLSITFDDGAELTILSDLGPYEAGQIGGGRQVYCVLIRAASSPSSTWSHPVRERAERLKAMHPHLIADVLLHETAAVGAKDLSRRVTGVSASLQALRRDGMLA